MNTRSVVGIVVAAPPRDTTNQNSQTTQAGKLALRLAGIGLVDSVS